MGSKFLKPQNPKIFGAGEETEVTKQTKHVDHTLLGFKLGFWGYGVLELGE